MRGSDGGDGWADAKRAHLLVLDGVYVAGEGEEAPTFHQLPSLSSADVADVLQVARVRIVRFLTKRGVLADAEHPEGLDGGCEDSSLQQLAAAAVTGQVPAGPEVRRRPPLALRERGEVQVTGALLAGDGGFSLHAATIAPGHDRAGREALVRYVLRPPLAQERLTQGSDDLVRITLKRPFSDGTYAVELDPLSLLCRLVANIPPPRFHTVRYTGVLASASKLRPHIIPQAEAASEGDDAASGARPTKTGKRCGWRP